MYQFINAMTKETYASAKGNYVFSHVPNTAVGYENCRKYITDNRYGHKYLVSANNEKDYFLHNERDKFSVFFSLDGDNVIIDCAYNNGRREESAKFLKKYCVLLCMIASCIKYDKIVSYVR